ncbi:MAG: endonuclease/exonuclease/phosphatase family protein [Myxococcales bacterium]|nr:endonuclease/exonuclease/phosphatase family protein [Myxococcales bacterium]
MRRSTTFYVAASLALALLGSTGCPASDSDADGGGDSRRADLGEPVRIKLATFNVRNLFDSSDDPDKLDDVPSKSEVDAKLKAIGIAIRRLDADIVALQEIENRAILDRLNNEELSSLGYEHVRLVEGNDVRGVDVALLSKFPVPRAVSWKNEVFKGVDGDTQNYGFSRDCLEATIDVAPDRKLVLLVNHLRANDDSDPTALKRREAQAAQVRRIADETLALDPRANLAVIGDLNDLPNSRTLELIRGTDGSKKPELADVAETIDVAERYTTIYRGDHRQIDYILVAPGLAEDLVIGSASVNHDGAFSATSDHFPVMATFDLR